MKKFISNLIKILWTITLTAGIVLAVDLWISLKSGDPITKNVWDKLTNQLEINTDKNIGQDESLESHNNRLSWQNDWNLQQDTRFEGHDTSIANLQTEITTLKTLLNNKADKTYVDTTVANASWVVVYWWWVFRYSTSCKNYWWNMKSNCTCPSWYTVKSMDVGNGTSPIMFCIK
jgi:hypothetical protein